MMGLWNDWGQLITVTVIHVDRCQITQIKTKDKQGYSAVQVGMGQRKIQNMTKPLLGHFLKARTPPKKHMCQFHVDPQNILPLGYMISVRHFTPGQYVDVKSRSINKGIQGTVRRFGFHTQAKTHGNSLSYRVLGSTGQRTQAGRVFKGKKMYGRMGNNIVTFKKMRVSCYNQIYKYDYNRSLIYIKGSVAGRAGSVVRICDTIHKDVWEKNKDLVNYPTLIIEQGREYPIEMEMYHGDCDPLINKIVPDNTYIVQDKEEVDCYDDQQEKDDQKEQLIDEEEGGDSST